MWPCQLRALKQELRKEILHISGDHGANYDLLSNGALHGFLMFSVPTFCKTAAVRRNPLYFFADPETILCHLNKQKNLQEAALLPSFFNQ